MIGNFYRAFEEEFRGSRELIKDRFKVYLSFVKPLVNFYPTAKITDLGCGCGECLELLMNNGFNRSGIDLDDEMLILRT